MKKIMAAGLLAVLLSGCGTFRFSATEAQKQNAWAHWQTCAAAQRTAEKEDASTTLAALTALTAEQSEAFVLDYGLPDARPTMETVEQLLTTGSDVAQQAKSDAQRRPDAWAVTDAAMELGIGIAGLLGGVYGLRFAAFLKQAKQKSEALKEIVEGNELFKQLCPTAVSDFKQAQSNQSAATRMLVTEVKG